MGKWWDPFNINDVISDIIPNEVKDIVPKEIVGVIDPVGIGGLNKNPSLANTLDPLNVSGKNTTGASSSPVGVGVAGAAPTYDKTLLDTFNAQLAIQRPLLEANQLLQPQWIDLSSQMQGRSSQASMDLMAKLYPQAGTIEAAYQNQLRGNALQQLQTKLPEYQKAFNALTPGYEQAIASTGQLAQQSMNRALQAPQLTNFEAQVGSPYAVSMPAQQPGQGQPGQGQPGQFQMGTTPPPGGVYPNGMVWEGPASRAPDQGQAMGQQGMAGMGSALSAQLASGRQFGEQKTWQDVAQPAYQSTNPNGPAYFAPRGAAPGQAAPSGAAPMPQAVATQQPAVNAPITTTPPSVREAVPVGPQQPVATQPQGAPIGSYVGGVQQYNPANIAAIAGTPRSAGYLNTVGNAQQIAALAGNVPGMENMNAAQSAAMAAGTAGTVPGGVAMQAAQTAAQAGKLAGGVPTATKMLGVTSAAKAAGAAGAVPTAAKMAKAQTAAAALQQAGAVPAAQNLAGMRTVDAALQNVGPVPGAQNLASVYGPQLQSGLENVNQESVNQYLSAMPGMQDYAKSLAQISQQELAAGRGLTPEEERMSQQSARAGYAARGTALGGQSVAAEVLNRADVANQRFQQRLGTAQQANAGIQGIYQPALEQSLARQQAGLSYDLGAQGQAFNQAETKDKLTQQQQAAEYAQALGAQTTGFSQAQSRDTLNAQLQAQKYGQLSGTQQAGFTQAGAQDAAAQSLQAQKYAQAMGTQGASFSQAQDITSMQKDLQQQKYAQSMGIQSTGFDQAKAKDVFGQATQAQQYAQAMGTQAAGFGQAATKDTTAASLQAQQYSQLMGAQGTAFSQAQARETAAQDLQQQRYTQAMGQETLSQGAQGTAFNQALSKEGLVGGAQSTAFNQALQRGTAEQQRLQAGTTIQAGQAQLGAGALGQIQNYQNPILAAYNQQPLLSQSVNTAQNMGLANQAASGNTLFNPESAMGFQSAFLPYQSNIALQQAGMQADASKAAGKSAMTGSIIGAAGSAAAVAFCWVAREV